MPTNPDRYTELTIQDWCVATYDWNKLEIRVVYEEGMIYRFHGVHPDRWTGWCEADDALHYYYRHIMPCRWSCESHPNWTPVSIPVDMAGDAMVSSSQSDSEAQENQMAEKTMSVTRKERISGSLDDTHEHDTSVAK